MSIPTVLRNDLPRMSGDEVNFLSILEVEFLLEIPMMFGLRFYLVLHIAFACKIFS
jgi:hypothetical protein